MIKKRVLVTGAGGFVGKHVVNSLLDMDAEVIAVDLYPQNINPRAKILTTNIFSENDDLYNALMKPDICLHLAWQDGFNHNADSHILNLPNHYRFIKYMLDGGLKHLAVMGTMHEVGYFVGEVNEDTPTNPQSSYGVAKNALRQATSILCTKYGSIYQWLRAYYITGDDESNKSIFTKIVQAEKEGKEIFPFNSGENAYDFIDILELSKYISLSVMQDKITGIINCSSGKPTKLKDRVESFIQEKGFNIKLGYGLFPDRPYDSPSLWGNTDKINQIIREYKSGIQ